MLKDSKYSFCQYRQSSVQPTVDQVDASNRCIADVDIAPCHVLHIVLSRRLWLQQQQTQLRPQSFQG